MILINRLSNLQNLELRLRSMRHIWPFICVGTSLARVVGMQTKIQKRFLLLRASYQKQHSPFARPLPPTGKPQKACKKCGRILPLSKEQNLIAKMVGML